MPILLNGETITITYSGRTFESMEQDFIDTAEVVFPEWDVNAFDPGVVVGNYQARLGSFLNFYTDRRAEENQITTCRLMSSAKRIGTPYGIQPSVSTTATVDMTVTVDRVGTIPASFRVGTESDNFQESIEYELLSDYSIPTIGTYIITFHHGTTYADEILGSSTGKPGQEFNIAKSPIAYNSSGNPFVTIEVQNGTIWELWTRVSTFYDSLSTSKHYKAILNDFGEYDIIFGDAVKGAIPPAGTNNIRYTVRVGGGKIGNQPAPGTIISVVNAQGSNIVTGVTNLTRPSGGSDAQTLASFKDSFPSIVTANDRIVTPEDADAILKDAGIGVHRSRSYRGSGPYEFIIVVAAEGTYAAPTGYWDAALEYGEGLLGAVGDYVIDRLVGDDVLTINPVNTVPIITTQKIQAQRRYPQMQLQRNLTTAISNYLSSNNYDIGEDLNQVEYGKMLDNVEGVDKVEITEFRRSPVARFVKGNDTALFSSYNVGQNVVSETWRIRFTDDTGYIVIGSVSGEQSLAGVADGSTYTTTGGELSFKMSYLAGDPPGYGTEYTIKTSSYEADTIALDDDEIISEGTTTITLTGGLA